MGRYYTTERLGPKRSLTPEGFLLCTDVPLARTGPQVYAAEDAYDPEHLPEGVSPKSAVQVWRTPENVFRPETVASFAGKAFTNDHPEEAGARVDVTPDNWHTFSAGTIQNPRRGSGETADLLVGDIMVTRRDAIEAIMSGKTELSCGYDSEFVLTEAGRLEQTNIIGNHVALVANGRCGPRCAIGDSAGNDLAESTEIDNPDEGKEPRPMSKKEQTMRFLRDLVGRAHKARDAKELEEMASDAAAEVGKVVETESEPRPERDVHVHVHPTDAEPEPHGGTHAREGEDPIPGLTQRVNDLEETCSGLTDALGEMRKTHDNMKKMHDDWSAHRRDEDHDWMERDAAKTTAAEPAEPGTTDAGEAAATKKIEGELELEAPQGTAAADAKKSRDSRYLEESFQRTLSLAEILAPGIQLPQFDVKAPPRKTYDSIVGLRRTALALAYSTPASRQVIDEAMGGRAFDATKVVPSALRPLFLAVGAARKQQNGALGGGAARRTSDDLSRIAGSGGLVSTTGDGKIKSVADFQKAADEVWAKN